MKEISEHIYNILKNDLTLRGLTGKSSDPYGIYKQFPPVDIDPPFIVFKYSGGPIDIYSDRGFMGTSDYMITFFGNNYEDLKIITFIILANQTINTYQNLVEIKSLQMVFESPVMFDPDFNIYKQTTTYRVKWFSTH